MSITTDARTYADSAVAQSRSALAHAGTALGQAGIALGAVNRRLIAEAPKPVYAALGAADLVAGTVTKRVEELVAEGEAQRLLARAQNEASDRLDDLRGRIAAGRQTVTTLPGTARDAGETYLSAARSTSEAYLQAAKGVYATLTDRGEARAAELRKNPRFAKLLGQAAEVAGQARDTVAPVAKSAFDAVTEPTVDEPTVAELSKPAKATRSTGGTVARKPAAKKATARKATARKSTGAKA